MYVDLGEIDPDSHHEVRSTTIEQIVARAQAILHPYTLDVRHVAWHSVYEVGHRLTDRFDDVPLEGARRRSQRQDPRVFIAGDACHTHSAKAGQGMNVSMQDGFNLAWKLGYVLTAAAPRASWPRTPPSARWSRRTSSTSTGSGPPCGEDAGGAGRSRRLPSSTSGPPSSCSGS